MMNRRELLLVVPALIVAGCGGGSTPFTNPQISQLITRLQDARAIWLEQNAAFKWYRMTVKFSSDITGQTWQISSEVFNPDVSPKLVSAAPELTMEQRDQIFEQFSTIERIYDYYIQKAQQLLANQNVESYDVAIDSTYSIPVSEALVLKSGVSASQLADRISVENYRNVRA